MKPAKKGVATVTIESTSNWDTEYAAKIGFSTKKLIFGTKVPPTNMRYRRKDLSMRLTYLGLQQAHR